MYSILTIFVERSAVHNLAAILDELLAELFSKGIILSEGKIAGVHAVLHELVEVGIGTVEDINTTGGDLAVGGGELSEIRETVRAAIEISPDGFGLHDTEGEWMHQTGVLKRALGFATSMLGSGVSESWQ